MLSLIYLSHQNLWLMPDIGDFPDNETLSDFVDLYFENFHPTFPILHKPTVLSTETPAVLLLSVAAVGATYAEKSVQPLAVALSELVRRIVTWMVGPLSSWPNMLRVLYLTHRTREQVIRGPNLIDMRLLHTRYKQPSTLLAARERCFCMQRSCGAVSPPHVVDYTFSEPPNWPWRN